MLLMFYDSSSSDPPVLIIVFCSAQSMLKSCPMCTMHSVAKQIFWNSSKEKLSLCCPVVSYIPYPQVYIISRQLRFFLFVCNKTNAHLPSLNKPRQQQINTEKTMTRGVQTRQISEKSHPHYRWGTLLPDILAALCFQ